MKKAKSSNPKNQEDDLPADLQYPASEDIYNREKKEPFSEGNETDSIDSELDVPGAELDDNDEAIGEEDEENNYYSLGGDAHNNLDENGDE